MHNNKRRRKTSILLFSVAAAAAMVQSVAWADQDFSWSGFIRSETAIRTTNEENPFNQGGNPFHGVPVTRTSVLGTDTATRSGVPANNSINMQMFRGELGAIWKMNNEFSMQAKMRVLYDPGWYDQYDPNRIGSQAQSTSAGNPGGVYGQPNYFQN